VVSSLQVTRFCEHKINSSSADQYTAELNQSGDNTLLYEIYELINSIWNNEELSQQWKKSVIVPMYKKG
jgi:hypothetical protein